MAIIHNYKHICTVGRFIICCSHFLANFTHRFAVLITIIGLLSFYQSPVLANHKNAKPLEIAILYPTVSKQYSGMFERLIDGITSIPGFHFNTFRINANTSAAAVKQWSKKHKIAGYIALGQSTYKLLETMKTDLPLIAGGMVATPPGITGISLSGDPEVFFRQLQLLNPDITRIFFVYSKKNNGWLIPRARKVSQKYDIEFVPLQVRNVKQATLQYNIVLQSVRPRTDAIWIPLDNVAPIDILLPEILQVSWNKHITVFSNNILHARRGALFALYPDQYKQGRRLVALLHRHLNRKHKRAELYPSVDLKTAVNVRTATHLDMRYSREMIKKFDQIYPAYK